MTPRILALVLAMATAAVLGAERRPVELPLPLVTSASASAGHLKAASDSGQGYLVDLCSGDNGVMFRAKPEPKLAPGRYRLHLLLAAGPAHAELVDPIDIYLAAGAANRRFRPGHYATGAAPGELTLDFEVTTEAPLAIAATWAVGDSLLLVPPQEKGNAFQKLLKRRAAAIAKSRQSGDGPDGKDLGAGADIDTAAVTEEETSELVRLAKAATPKYRLAIAGMHLEALCPVGIEKVATDKPAYDPGEEVRLEVTLRNFAATGVQAQLTATLTPGDPPAAGTTPAEQQPASVTVTVPAAGTLTHKFAAPFTTRGLGSVTRVPVRVTWQDTRPATAETLFVLAPPKRAAGTAEKTIFAHYMGCWPAGVGPIYGQRQTEGENLRHEAPNGSAYYYGGHVRNFDLLEPTQALTPEASADLEIRRAIRIGIDGFAIDAWAGGNDARRSVDMLFKVAEEKNYPFQVTVCIDPCCGGDLVGTVKELLDKHGKSPKLARRNGKPLVFGYMSTFTGYGNILKYLPERLDSLRAQPLGWYLQGQALEEAARQVGQPIYYQYCMSSFLLNVDPKLLPKDALTQAAGILARYAEAVGSFNWLGPQQPEISKAVLGAGAEWSMPVGMYQKENIPFECYMPKGTDWMHWGQGAIDQKATLLQIITWNDYGENTNIAPAYNTRYTLYDLTGYDITLWKTGKAPVPDHDRVYLIYRKYPPGAKIYPFHAKFPEVDGGVIEVLTILPKPAQIRLPGRNVEFEAPAGFSRKQFPVTAGPMIAELLRAGKVELRLESPEPITDKPFREDNAMVCWSTEEERLWKEDFGNTPPFWYSEYGDVDHDGLPNWFEMYWFSKERGFKPKATDKEELEGADEIKYSRWLDFATAGYADPKADPDGDGKTNQQEYQNQTDPTQPAPGSVTPGD